MGAAALALGGAGIRERPQQRVREADLLVHHLEDPCRLGDVERVLGVSPVTAHRDAKLDGRPGRGREGEDHLAYRCRHGGEPAPQ